MGLLNKTSKGYKNSIKTTLILTSLFLRFPLTPLENSLKKAYSN